MGPSSVKLTNFATKPEKFSFKPLNQDESTPSHKKPTQKVDANPENVGTESGKLKRTILNKWPLSQEEKTPILKNVAPGRVAATSEKALPIQENIAILRSRQKKSVPSRIKLPSSRKKSPLSREEKPPIQKNSELRQEKSVSSLRHAVPEEVSAEPEKSPLILKRSPRRLKAKLLERVTNSFHTLP